MPTRGSNFGGGCVVLFIVAWIAVVLLADVGTLRNLWLQNQASSWPVQTGKVLSAKLLTHHDSDGTDYEPALDYVYQVEGRTYHGSRVRYGNKSSSLKWAQEVLEQFPAESQPVIHYRPDQPGEAVLQTGVTPGEVSFFIFLLPFNLISLGIPLLWWLHKACDFGPLGFPQGDQGQVMVLYTSYKHPVAVAWVAAFLISFALIGVNIVVNPSFAVLALEGVALPLAGLLGAAVAARRNADLARQVWVDCGQRRLHLPRVDNLRWEQLESFGVEVEIAADSDGDPVRKVHLNYTLKNRPAQRWLTVNSSPQAEAINHWLCQHTQLEEVKPEQWSKDPG